MEEKVEAIIKDVELYTGNYLGDAEKRYYTDGATDAKVFSLAKKYLIKITDLNTIKTQVEFFRQNHDAAFQNLVCHSEDLGYLCFDFIDGDSKETEIQRLPACLYHWKNKKIITYNSLKEN